MLPRVSYKVPIMSLLPLVTPLCPGAEGPVEGSERHHHGGEVQSRGEARDHRRGVAQDIPHPRQVSTYGDK